jgi:23S rRNA pseudouridine955/2504/2580 synthase
LSKNYFPRLEAARVLVAENCTGQRIDHFLLRHTKGVPKSHLYRVLRSGEVRVNSRRVRPDFRLTDGDRVRIPPLRDLPEPTLAAPPLHLRVMFEDEHIVVVDKPAGLAVHGGSGVSHGVIERLRAGRPQQSFLELVHRLDRETSGLLIVAKRRPALIGLQDALRQGAVEKHYVALVLGDFTAPRRVDLPLLKYVLAGGQRRVRVDPAGKASATRFVPLQRVADLTLLRAELETGRTHQIRAHLAHLGHPICGDDRYGDFQRNRAWAKAGLKRMFLHAQTIAFAHPVCGQAMALSAPLPPELSAALVALGSE